MFKLFEWIGSIIAIAAIIQIASDPRGALNDIARGPAPNLRAFSDKLMGVGSHEKLQWPTRARSVKSSHRN